MNRNFIAFGESLFRTVTARGERLHQAQSLGFHLGGTELNIAANLQALGVPSSWVSALPAGPSGEMILDRVRALGVDTSSCVTAKSARVGWYLMESGSAPRPDIVFHRNASAMADETSFDFDWSKILNGARVLHTSGVTCGLSETLTNEISKCIKAATSAGALVSYDLNFRRNVWSVDESVKRQTDIVKNVDILFCSRAELKLFFGDDYEKQKFAKVFAQSRIKILVLSHRNADQSEYGIDVINREQTFTSKRHSVVNVDRIGVGDAAAAGFFKIFLTSDDFAKAAEWAALCGAMKYGISGDMALLKPNEVERGLNSDTTRILR